MKWGETSIFAPFYINLSFSFLSYKPGLSRKKEQNASTPATLVDSQCFMGGRSFFSLHLSATPCLKKKQEMFLQQFQFLLQELVK